MTDIKIMTDTETGIQLMMPIRNDQCEISWCAYPMPHQHTVAT